MFLCGRQSFDGRKNANCNYCIVMRSIYRTYFNVEGFFSKMFSLFFRNVIVMQDNLPHSCSMSELPFFCKPLIASSNFDCSPPAALICPGLQRTMMASKPSMALTKASFQGKRWSGPKLVKNKNQRMVQNDWSNMDFCPMSWLSWFSFLPPVTPFLQASCSSGT